ncbi:MAG TPA: hypothetical protein DCF33_15985 [Saprospirales bacterium]|nr:hypothetical protein [Saprospirales bacterium]
MKKSIFVLFLLFSAAISMNAQGVEAAAPAATAPAAPVTGANNLEVRKATDALAEKYSLTADQAKQMYTVQLRKAKNLAQIESLKTSDPVLYETKVENVQKSTLSGIRRILNSEEQVALFQKTQTEIRAARSKKQKELVAKKATQQEINTALISIYAE